MKVCRDYTEDCYQRKQQKMEFVTEFLATVIIPKGFIVCDANYSIYLTIDMQDLSEVGMTQSCRCGSFDDCTTLKNCVLLNGNLVYNVTMEYFRAACLMDSDNLTKETSFNNSGDIYVNKILLCRRDRIITMPEYSLIPVQGEEFITCSNGQNIFRMNNKRDFARLLENPDIEKVIHIPYRLFISIKNSL